MIPKPGSIPSYQQGCNFFAPPKIDKRVDAKYEASF